LTALCKQYLYKETTVENAATPKITINEYLAKRGPVKALTTIEAQAFGIEYPLVQGWARRHGRQVITQAMIDQLRASIEAANKSTAAKARRALDGALGLPVAAVTREPRVKVASPTREARRSSMFPGFAVRPRGAAGLPWKT
jgi:hypothetical protein